LLVTAERQQGFEPVVAERRPEVAELAEAAD